MLLLSLSVRLVARMLMCVCRDGDDDDLPALYTRLEDDVSALFSAVVQTPDSCVPNAFTALSGLSMARDTLHRTGAPFATFVVTGYTTVAGLITYMSLVCIVRDDALLLQAAAGQRGSASP